MGVGWRKHSENTDRIFIKKRQDTAYYEVGIRNEKNADRLTQSNELRKHE